MALTPTGGFAAISQKSPAGPLARKQLVRNSDGSVSLQYVDNQTGQQLNSLQGYNLVEANNYLQLDDLGLDPLQEPEKKETTAEAVKKPVMEQRQGGDSDNSSDPSGQGFARSSTNNFGYIDKPGFMGFASAIPGPLGMLGKVANVGINMNNTGAVNEARSMMGLPKQSFVENAKSTVKDQHGQIGDVKIETPQGTKQYPVGFEAQDKFGRTNLTPQEAVLRANAHQTDLSLASKPEVKSDIDKFKSEFPEARQGIFSKVTSAAENFIDNLFGRDNDSYDFSANQGRGELFDRSKGFDYFPDAPAAPSGNPTHSQERERDFSGGFSGSSQADRAAASGGGGLY